MIEFRPLAAPDLPLLSEWLSRPHVAEFLVRDPGVTRIQADPSPRNSRAIRCYEKVGFRRVGAVETPDGPAVLMIIDREERDAATAPELRVL